jgi:6-phosphogluconate dehydrogenase
MSAARGPSSPRTPQDFVAALERPRRLLIMVNAGAAADAVIDKFALCSRRATC